MNKFVSVLLFISNSCLGQKSVNVNACTLAKNMTYYCNTLNDDTLKHILSRDISECNLLLVDTIIHRCIFNADKKGFDILQKIWSVSDGELSEYIVEKTGLIFHKNFLPFFEYLYNNRQNTTKNNLENLLIESWSSEASVSKNRDKSVEAIRLSAVKNVKESKKDNQEKIQYLSYLLKKINPKYLD